MQWIARLVWDEQAATAVEYAVMLALILVAVVGAISQVGSSSGGLWGDSSSKISSAVRGS